jgi:hypothetical protein
MFIVSDKRAWFAIEEMMKIVEYKISLIVQSLISCKTSPTLPTFELHLHLRFFKTYNFYVICNKTEILFWKYPQEKKIIR